jgi:hypothetical protein
VHDLDAGAVGPGDDRDAGLVHPPKQLHHFRPARPIVRARQVLRNGEAAAPEIPFGGGRHSSDERRVRRREVSVLGHVQTLERHHRGVAVDLLVGHRSDNGLHRGALEVDVLAVAARSFKAHDPIGAGNDALRHRLHDDPVDVSDFVVASGDRVERTHAGRDVAMNMKSEFVRFGDARAQPRGIERAIKLHAGEPAGFRLIHERNRFGLTGRDVGDLGGVRAFPVDERGRIHMRGQQLSSGDTFSPVDGADVVVSRIADRRDAHRQFLDAGEVVSNVHVAIPDPRDQCLAAAVDDLRGVGDAD